MSNELTEKEKQELEEEKAIAWLRGQKVVKKNFNEKAFQAHRENVRKENEAIANEAFATNLKRINRSIQNEGRKGKNPKEES